MIETMTFTVPGMHCGHCKASVTEEVSAVDGVEDVQIDLGTKLVLVRGNGLNEAKLRAAIEDAGYEAA